MFGSSVVSECCFRVPTVGQRAVQVVPELRNLPAEAEKSRRGGERFVGDGGARSRAAHDEHRVGHGGADDVPPQAAESPVQRVQVFSADLGIEQLVQVSQLWH